jgi:CBS-domain-containing membrane protein
MYEVKPRRMFRRFMWRRYPTQVSFIGVTWAAMLLLLVGLMDHLFSRSGIWLVPPFAATLSILLYLPTQPVAQPLPVIVGCTVGAGIGTVVSLVGHGPLIACAVAAVLLILLPRIGFYHPPGIALSMYPLLLHPGLWFALRVVLPFSLIAVLSRLGLARLVPGQLPYPACVDS